MLVRGFGNAATCGFLSINFITLMRTPIFDRLRSARRSPTSSHSSCRQVPRFVWQPKTSTTVTSGAKGIARRASSKATSVSTRHEWWPDLGWRLWVMVGPRLPLGQVALVQAIRIAALHRESVFTEICLQQTGPDEVRLTRACKGDRSPIDLDCLGLRREQGTAVDRDAVDIMVTFGEEAATPLFSSP